MFFGHFASLPLRRIKLTKSPLGFRVLLGVLQLPATVQPHGDGVYVGVWCLRCEWEWVVVCPVCLNCSKLAACPVQAAWPGSKETAGIRPSEEFPLVFFVPPVQTSNFYAVELCIVLNSICSQCFFLSGARPSARLSFISVLIGIFVWLCMIQLKC